MRTLMMIVIPILLLSYGCSDDKQNPTAPENPNGIPFDVLRRKIADQAISIFENGTTVLRYDYIENIHDGRGYTAGRAGFTTATCDLLEVVTRYTTVVPSNPLATFIPRLQVLCNTADSSVSGLDNLPMAWKNAASDSTFRKIQDTVVDEFYYNPAVQHAKDLKLKFPLSLLNIYDACIQHGNGNDPDGVPAMITKATSLAGGSPSGGADEKIWLDKFMIVRRNTLLNPFNQRTKDAWAQSVDRVDAFRGIYNGQNFYLKEKVKLTIWSTDFYLPE